VSERDVDNWVADLVACVSTGWFPRRNGYMSKGNPYNWFKSYTEKTSVSFLSKAMP
jgi:hypothetical protein